MGTTVAQSPDDRDAEDGVIAIDEQTAEQRLIGRLTIETLARVSRAAADRGSRGSVREHSPDDRDIRQQERGNNGCSVETAQRSTGLRVNVPEQRLLGRLTIERGTTVARSPDDRDERLAQRRPR